MFTVAGAGDDVAAEIIVKQGLALAEYATASSAADLSFEQFIARQGDRLSQTLAQRL